MRDSQFAVLTRALDNLVSRRGALGLLSVAASLLALDEADARNRKHRKRKTRRRRKDLKSKKGPVCKRAGTRACDPTQAAPGQDIRNCNLANGALAWADLSVAKASRANLSGAHLHGATLDRVDLSQACLAGATLRGASLRGANLDRADLGGADLCGADLRGTQVTSNQLASASVCCSTQRSDGSSAAPCSSGRTCCEDGCIDLANSSANCGACGNACAAGQVCCAGSCVAPGIGQRCGTTEPACISPSQDLQQVFDDAEANATIHLCAGTWHLTRTLLISKNLTILGGIGGSTVLDGGSANIQLVGIRQRTTVEFENITFTNGLADEGAGIFNQGYLTLYNCQLTHNTARLGGGVYNEGTVRLYYGNLANNIVKQGSDPVFNPDYRGGAIYNDEGAVSSNGTAFTHNTATDSGRDAGEGGAIFNYYGQVTLNSGTQVTDNHAEAWGGGIYNEGGKLIVQAGTSITSNAAGYSGGGIYADGGTSDIAAGAVTNNNPDNCYGSLNANCL